jgi:hypothetical protein
VRARTRHAAAPAPEPSWRAAGAGIELQSFSGPRDPAAGAARAQAVDDAAETLRRLELARPRLSLARIYPLPDPAVLWRPCRTGSFMIRTAAQLRTLCPGPRGRRARRRGGAPPRRRRAGCPRLPRDKRTTVAGCCWAARGARTPRARRSRRRSCRPSSGGGRWAWTASRPLLARAGGWAWRPWQGTRSTTGAPGGEPCGERRLARQSRRPSFLHRSALLGGGKATRDDARARLRAVCGARALSVAPRAPKWANFTHSLAPWTSPRRSHKRPERVA